MTTQVIQEATLIAPAFNGTDEEIAAATNAWSSIVNSLSYCNQLYVGGSTVPMSPENKKALFSSLICYAQCRLDELNNVTQPPQVTSMPTNPAPAAAEPTVAMTVATDSYAESQEQEKKLALLKEERAKIVKRMRELAGIPHESNYV